MIIRPENTVSILLAAGQSRRFGDADKLLTLWQGRPLVARSAAMLASIPFRRRILVGSAAVIGLGLDGFEAIETDDPTAPQSHSLSLGMEAAVTSSIDAVLIALADMPLIEADHVKAIFAKATHLSSSVASSDGTVSMPPALFGRTHFKALCELTGDQGARHLLANAQQVLLPAEALVDIDTLADFDFLKRKKIGSL